ncbi:amidase domain-containing protein [Subtercola endophyticus]|uniref:amidase domain-containing protein n=1 Tax=Subtercola endophyticus TaxID=2895559 RepID=UPI001E2D25F7|nr:amidase domain-containing protein [Subtercola endophyticus]UFS58583.1 amidase domain-containing protein [Subtercola endophyticus]
MITTRRAFLTLAAGSGLMALAGCAALSAQGETKALSTPTMTPTPQVTAASVAVGSLCGGTTVSLTGQVLTDVVSVAVGANPATSVTVVDDNTVSFVTPAAVDYQPANAAITLTKADGSVVDSTKQFSYEAVTPVDKQLQYAFTYWQNYNLADWGIFSDNDCGNFVNQTLVARGWAQNDDWYSDYVSDGDYSLSWIRGTEMDDYLASRSDTTRLELADRAALTVGDVVMFDWDPQNDNGPDHTMVVSRLDTNVDGTIAVKLVGHTVDAQFRDLDTAITVDNPGGTAHFYHLA